MSFIKQYQQALALKLTDVEEPVDIHFHRPLAASLTVFIARTPLSPNHVTLLSLLSGTTGLYFLYTAFFTQAIAAHISFPIAALCYFFSVIFDCADGQLARMRGGGSIIGRIFDGFVDLIVLLPAYLVIGFGILEQFGLYWFSITAVAGLTTPARTAYYDKLKNLYLDRVDPGVASGGAPTGQEIQEALQHTSGWFENFLLRFYEKYISFQETLTSADPPSGQHDGDIDVQSFRDRHHSTMRIASYTGLGTHMVLLYTSIGLSGAWPQAILLLQLLFATLGNLLLIYLIYVSQPLRESQSTQSS